ENEGDDLPDGVAAETRLHRGQLGGPPTEIDAGRYNREHTGRLDGRGGDEREVAAHHADRDLHRWVVETPARLRDEEADNEPDRDPADHAPAQPPGSFGNRERACDNSRD